MDGWAGTRDRQEALDISLEWLGIHRADLCLSHGPDPGTPIEATWEGFAATIEAGKVSHIGACNLAPDQLRDALDSSERLGLPRNELVQNQYNLLTRVDERELFGVCAEYELGVTPFSPMAGGVLTCKYQRNQTPPEDSRLGL